MTVAKKKKKKTGNGACKMSKYYNYRHEGKH